MDSETHNTTSSATVVSPDFATPRLRDSVTDSPVTSGLCDSATGFTVASETPRLRDSETAFITVVMPVRNEERFIAETIGQLLQQDYPEDRYEIIVADGMSDDMTRDIVQEISTHYSQVKLMDNQKRLSSAGRNVGFKNGKGDYFLVVDGHCFIPDNRLFQNVVDYFEKSTADCLGRPQPLDPPGLTLFQKAVALARGSKLGHGGDSLIYGEFEGYASPVSNGAAYRREVIEKIGYVDENFDACEDLEFNYRVEKDGIKAFTSPKLTVRYYPRENLKGLLRQMMRYGRGRFRFICKHPEAITLNQLVPVGFVLSLFLLFVAGLGELVLVPSSLFPVPWSLVTIPLATVYCLYAVLVLAESLRLAKNVEWKCLSALPMVFFTIHFGLGYGFAVEALKSILPMRAGSQKTWRSVIS